MDDKAESEIVSSSQVSQRAMIKGVEEATVALRLSILGRRLRQLE